MTDLTSEEYRELADLCGRANTAIRDAGDSLKLWPNQLLANCLDFFAGQEDALLQKASLVELRDMSERQLREDIKTLIYVTPSESGVAGTVDAIIRRVREEKS